jgi:hypothetical protein
MKRMEADKSKKGDEGKGEVGMEKRRKITIAETPKPPDDEKNDRGEPQLSVLSSAEVAMLPPEVLAHCLSFVLDAHDLLAARCVSHLFLALADHEPFVQTCIYLIFKFNLSILKNH